MRTVFILNTRKLKKRKAQKTFVRVSHFTGDISGFSFSERKFRIGQPNNGREI